MLFSGEIYTTDAVFGSDGSDKYHLCIFHDENGQPFIFQDKNLVSLLLFWNKLNYKIQGEFREFPTLSQLYVDAQTQPRPSNTSSAFPFCVFQVFFFCVRSGSSVARCSICALQSPLRNDCDKIDLDIKLFLRNVEPMRESTQEAMAFCHRFLSLSKEVISIAILLRVSFDLCKRYYCVS